MSATSTTATPGSSGSPMAGSANMSTLSEYAGPYVTDMLGKAQALSNTPYQVYGGPMTAGESSLQNKMFQGLGGLNFPGQLGQSFSSSSAYQPPGMAPNTFANQPIGMGAGAPPMGTTNASGTGATGTGGGQSTTAPLGIASQYMNPYLQSVLQPQLEELRRQSQINLQPGMAKMTQAGGYGGGRQAIMESEANRNLLQQQNQAIGTGYANAFDKAMQQFNTEQGQAKTLADLMGTAGAQQRGIEQEGITADYNEFLAQRDDPMKKVQFLQSMLQGLPISTVSNVPQSQTGAQQAVGGMQTVYAMLENLGVIPKKA
jgi:hypothetical protein